jgi:hypothetical protein
VVVVGNFAQLQETWIWEYLLRHSMKTMELGVSSTFFLEQIHDGAAGVVCVWRRKFGVELFFGSGAAWSSPKHVVKGDSFGEFQCPKNQYELDQMKAVQYASVVGSLQYAQVCTRPDLAFITGVLGRYQDNPGIEHWKMAKKAMRCVQGTKHYMLTYRSSAYLEIKGYSDADYAGDRDERKSTSGYIFTLAGGAISWRSSKQKLVASSTMHTEFIACHDTIRKVIWLKKFVPDLRVVDCINKPIKMYCDNQPAVYYAHNNKSSNATKPVEVKFYVVKDGIRDKTISLEHIGTVGEFRKACHPRNVEFNEVREICFSGEKHLRFSGISIL